MSWLCWLRRHRWFPTVRTRHRWQPFGEPTYELEEYTEHICLRCQENEARWVKTVDSWNFVLDSDGDPPDWMEMPRTRHFPLPGDW